MRGTRAIGALLTLAGALAMTGCHDETGTPGGAAPTAHDLVATPAAGAPVVSIRVVFEAGAIDDPAGKEGLASLTAALVAGGGGGAMSSAAVLERLYPLGGTIRGWADQETTTFVAEGPAEYANELYAVLRDLLLEPRLDAADFERVRGERLVLLGQRLRDADDEQLVRRVLELLLFEGHPYGHLPEGTIRGLEAVTMADVATFQRERYTRDHAVFGVAGAYPAELPTAIRTDLASLPGGSVPREPLFPPPAVGTPEVVIVEKLAPAASIALGFPVDVSRADTDYPALLLAVSWLGEHRTPYGRLYRELREARGLNYGDYAYVEHFVEAPGTHFAEPGHPRREQYFSIWLRSLAPANAAFALRTALAELDRLVLEGIPADEFERQREFLRQYLRLGVVTPGQQLGEEIDDHFYGTPDRLAQLDDALARLTPELVRAALVRHLRADRYKAAIVTHDAELLRRQLTAGLPTPAAPLDGAAVGSDERDRAYASWPLGLSPASVHVVPAERLFDNALPPWRKRG